MSKVARIVTGVHRDTLKVFNQKEIQELHGKLSDGDIIVDSLENMYIWPNTAPFVTESLRHWTYLEISITDTEKHKNAIDFFAPVIEEYGNTLLTLRLHLKPHDEGLVAIFGENALNSNWKIVASFCEQKKTYECHFYELGKRFIFDNRDFRNSGYSDVCKFWHDCYDSIFDAEIMALVCVEQLAYERLKSALSFTKNTLKFHTDFIQFFSRMVKIDDEMYKFHPQKNLYLVMFRIAARDYEALQRHLKLSEIKYELRAKTEPDVFWNRVNDQSGNYDFVTVKNHPNALLRQKKRHQILVDLCMIFANFTFPYHIYDIICSLRCFDFSKRYINVAIIEGVFNSIRKVWAQREEKEKKLKT